MPGKRSDTQSATPTYASAGPHVGLACSTVHKTFPEYPCGLGEGQLCGGFVRSAVLSHPEELCLVGGHAGRWAGTSPDIGVVSRRLPREVSPEKP